MSDRAPLVEEGASPGNYSHLDISGPATPAKATFWTVKAKLLTVVLGTSARARRAPRGALSL